MSCEMKTITMVVDSKCIPIHKVYQIILTGIYFKVHKKYNSKIHLIEIKFKSFDFDSAFAYIAKLEGGG